MTDSGADGKDFLIDWVHLPERAAETSLWVSLHDALLERVHLNRHSRILDLGFDVPHLREFHGFPDATRFLLRFEGVRALRVEKSVGWPGDFSVPDGTPYAEAEKLIAGNRAKSIRETVSWPEFVNRIEQEQGSTEILNPSLATGSSGVALRMFMHVNDDFYPEVFVSSERMSISLSSGEDVTLMEFLLLGKHYWDTLSAEAPSEPANG